MNDGLIIDLFAGGGGASTGIEQAIGRYVDIAINHDPEAISLHEANHPHTKHIISDVFEVDPLVATEGKPVDILWASPDCKHFSRAKGGKPVDKNIRSLAWVVVKWAKQVRPRMICLENVPEFRTWGPLDDAGLPCPNRKGHTFHLWVESLKKLGYAVEWKELSACDYGAPTIRKRLFLVARRDGLPIKWPFATHGKGLVPYRTAAECIDWTIPTPSIFERTRPLKDATLRRIVKGIVRYVVQAEEPYIVNGSAPVMTEIANASSPRCMRANEPLRTIVASVKGGHHALVSAFLAKHYSGVVGSELKKPIGTVTSIDHHALVSSHLVKLRNNQFGQGVNEPMPTLTAGGGHVGEVRALLVKYYGNDRDGVALSEPLHTIPTRDRFGLITVQIAGEPYIITDIGMRMLQPHELYAAQGFPSNYRIDKAATGKAITKTAQVRMCGNSVCPPVAKALIEANYSMMQEQRHAA